MAQICFHFSTTRTFSCTPDNLHVKLKIKKFVFQFVMKVISNMAKLAHISGNCDSTNYREYGS